MNIFCIMHASFEPPGIIEEWVQEQGHTLCISRTYDGEPLPDAASFDFMIIMGGPQSSLDKENPYLADEISLIKEAINKDKIVLGICLGAQLISEALGAETERSPQKEIGVFPIELAKIAEKDPLFSDFPKIFDVVHWHNDMPGIPSGSTILANSERCPRQIIRFAPKVYGFQCHLEITHGVLKGLIAHCPNDLQSAKFVQSAEQMVHSNLETINLRMKAILDRIVDLS